MSPSIKICNYELWLSLGLQLSLLLPREKIPIGTNRKTKRIIMSRFAKEYTVHGGPFPNTNCGLNHGKETTLQEEGRNLSTLTPSSSGSSSSRMLQHCRSWVSLLQILWGFPGIAEPLLNHGWQNASCQSVSHMSDKKQEFSITQKVLPGWRVTAASTSTHCIIHFPCILPGHQNGQGYREIPCSLDLLTNDIKNCCCFTKVKAGSHSLPPSNAGNTVISTGPLSLPNSSVAELLILLTTGVRCVPEGKPEGALQLAPLKQGSHDATQAPGTTHPHVYLTNVYLQAHFIQIPV